MDIGYSCPLCQTNDFRYMLRLTNGLNEPTHVYMCEGCGFMINMYGNKNNMYALRKEK